MKPIVTLINPQSHKYVLETIYVLWERSKTDAPTPLDVEQVAREVPRPQLEKLFWDVLRQHIPIAEHIHFTFMLDGISVSLREQMVRHRIGTHVGDNFGVDIIPELASSSWWSQSMRIQDMGKFADNEMYRVPESLDGVSVPWNGSQPSTDTQLAGRIPARVVFNSAMDDIQRAYNALVAAGVPMEDARELIPLGAQHSISWDINLQALLHVLGKRGCWILQLGIWGPIIHGMVNELAKHVHPMFSRIVAPPCIDQDDHFKSCQYRLENTRRMADEQGVVNDAHPPCPLWLCKDEQGQEEFARSMAKAPIRRDVKLPNKTALVKADNLVPRHREMKARAEEYRSLWHHDPYTWEPVK